MTNTNKLIATIAQIFHTLKRVIILLNHISSAHNLLVLLKITYKLTLQLYYKLLLCRSNKINKENKSNLQFKLNKKTSNKLETRKFHKHS